MIGLLQAEWIKIRTLRATIWTVGLTVLMSVGLAYVFGRGFRQADTHDFDPLFVTFYSLTLGQLPLVVLAVFAVTSEYTSGTIGASFTAVPERGRFLTAKALTGALVALAVAVVTVLATFATAQAGLGAFGTSLTAKGSPSAAVGACLYLMLIYLFATGVAVLFRGPIPALGVLLPLLFLGSQGLGSVPGIKIVTQYLPDQAGMVVMHIVGQGDDPAFARPYGPWSGLGIMALWVAAALGAGYLTLRRRDV